jgi:aldose 1-epimerase
MVVIELEAGSARVTIDPERGGRLASLVIGGRELLIGPWSADDRSIRWGCFLMAPWPGRLASGRFEWQGETVQLPRNHGEHAIHGLGWDRGWHVATRSTTSAALELDLAAAGWPPGGTVRERFSLEPGFLRLDAEIVARDPMPAALGWHPWFVRGDEPVRLRVDADRVQETVRMIPTGRTLPVVGRLDLRRGPVLGRRRLDHAYLGAASPAVIDWPDLRLTLSFEPSPSSLVVYSPAHALCVEPQTAPPNALVAGDATILAAGERLSSTLVLSWATVTPEGSGTAG